MIILPTEKRFDWKYAPIVLFSIVLLNIFIFFVYQSGDNEKFSQAFQIYSTENFIEIEWPFFKKYLTEKENLATLEKFQKQYDQNETDEIILNIILQTDFYRYLRFEDAQYQFFVEANNQNWFEKRAIVNDLMQSTSIKSSGLTPANIRLFHLLSYQFLHGDLMHLLGNLFFLIVCGFAVEAAIGHWRFLLFYLLCGIAGGLLHSLVNLKEMLPLVGASGSISGVMAMYLGLFRLKKIEFFYWIFIFVGYFRAPALLILVFYIGKELYEFFINTDSNVAFMAHAGGFICGGLLMFAAYFLNPKMFNQEYIEEDQTIDPNQEKLATIYEFISKYQFEAAKKALSRAINENGLTFDFALIRYNLEKIDKGADYQQSMMAILTTKNPTEYEIKKIEKVWLENSKHYHHFNNDDALKVAFNLIKLKHPMHAASICDQLVKNNIKEVSLGILAKKISAAFAQLNEPSQKAKYEAIANQLLAGTI